MKVSIFYFQIVTAIFLLSICARSAFCDLIDDPAAEQSPVVGPTKQSSGGTASPGLISDDLPTKNTAGPRKNNEGTVIGSGGKQPAENKQSAESKKADKTERNRNPDAPIKFWSKGLSGDKTGGIVILEEDVVVIQDDLRISADKATLKVDKITNEVLEVVAVGNVLFSRKDPDTGQPVTADSREAVFNNALRTVVLKGDPRLIRGTDVVRGKQITYDLTSGWVKATRVEGVVQPTRNEPKKSGGNTSQASPSGAVQNSLPAPQTVTPQPIESPNEDK